MKLEELLAQRSGDACELCQDTSSLKTYEVPPGKGNDPDMYMLLCDTCLTQVEKRAELNSNHWKCLSKSMWSEVPAVQVVSWRILNRLRNESWAAESLEMLYLSDEILTWAKATGDHENDATVDLQRDCNGQILQHGDTVVLTKSLDVKGSTLNAKMGTVVKNIRLVEDNTAQIEGRIEGQMIVILTKFVRKQNS
ncbi:PhnA protein [Chitinophaga agrisoli]|uniref:PhnA protein n=1 Tax=Chitinophaga agrisoli TaxID=2607653 RepID=A0A5B2VK26_9BACT|nr:alkylphosphonate utilization protein [Chitinophaga agrisoli]KAA2239953.1 PhnA protein [Chitinophaga agrisoli]